MKAKTLLAAGLMMVATAASSLAQTVYSVNAVGFVNVECPPGFSLIANPLAAATNTVVALFPNVASGTQVYKFNPASGGFSSSAYSSFLGAWTDATMTLVPGEGFFYKNPGTTTVTNTFVGNVQTGTALTTPLAAGFTLVSSQVPQQGLVSTDLGLPTDSGTTIYTFSNAANGYQSSAFSSFLGGWTSGEPVIGVGQGFFVKRATGGSWVRSFQVNQ